MWRLYLTAITNRTLWLFSTGKGHVVLYGYYLKLGRHGVERMKSIWGLGDVMYWHRTIGAGYGKYIGLNGIRYLYIDLIKYIDLINVHQYFKSGWK